jgi:1-deoxy-D-xylulose-5-phosphate synthase
VIDPRWVIPVDDALVTLAAGHRRVVVVEDNLRAGGIGSAVAERLGLAGVGVPVHLFGVAQRFLDHGTRAQLLDEVGLTAQEVSRQVVEAVAGSDACVPSDPHRPQLHGFDPGAGQS